MMMLKEVIGDVANGKCPACSHLERDDELALPLAREVHVAELPEGHHNTEDK
jgi:hypothetical protein